MRFRKVWPLPEREITQTEIFDMLAEACVTGHIRTTEAKTSNPISACRYLRDSGIAWITVVSENTIA